MHMESQSMTNQRNKLIKKQWKELRDNAKCVGPGPTHIGRIQFAHIEPTGLEGKGRGRKERLYDILKNPDKYVPLCESCHLDFDN